MGHTIFAGSFAALETRWIELTAELQSDDPLLEINVLVGSNILATYLKRRSAQSGHSLTNVRFYTFLDLANRMAAVSASGPAKRRLPHLGDSVILDEILTAHTPSVYASLSGLQGFKDA